MSGSKISITVKVNWPVPVFLDKSVAWQDIVVCPIENTEPDSGLHSVTNSPSILSNAVAIKEKTFPPVEVSTDSSEGTASSGGVVSCTVTKNEPVFAFPASSVAVHSTVVVPIGYTIPDSWEHETVTSVSTSSVADTSYSTNEPPGPSASKVRFSMDWKSGAAESVTRELTVTEKYFVSVFPTSSVAVHVTSVEPIGYTIPDSWEHEIVTSVSKLSVADTSYDTEVPLGSSVSASTSSGTFSTGFSLSSSWHAPFTTISSDWQDGSTTTEYKSVEDSNSRLPSVNVPPEYVSCKVTSVSDNGDQLKV